MLNRLRPFLFPALALAIAFAAWQSYGAKGLILAALMISFWVLLHFTKLMRLLRAAAKRPVGHVRDARALHRHLRPGQPLVDVVRFTQSLGQLRSEAGQEPQRMEWGDEQGHVVTCTFSHGRLEAFELLPSENAGDPVSPVGDGPPPAQP